MAARPPHRQPARVGMQPLRRLLPKTRQAQPDKEGIRIMQHPDQFLYYPTHYLYRVEFNYRIDGETKSGNVMTHGHSPISSAEDFDFAMRSIAVDIGADIYRIMFTSIYIVCSLRT